MIATYHYQILLRIFFDCEDEASREVNIEKLRKWLTALRENVHNGIPCIFDSPVFPHNVFEDHDYHEAAKFLSSALVGWAEQIETEPYIKINALGRFVAEMFELEPYIKELEPKEAE